MLILALFAFFHFDGITKEIFSYAATKGCEKVVNSALPLASSLIDHTFLQFDDTGNWDNYIFKQGIQVLLSFSLIKQHSSKSMYDVHPLIHAWERDRMSFEDKQTYCLKAYVISAGFLAEKFDEQPYGFRRVLVTHVRANIQHSVMKEKKMVDRYFDDAYSKFGRMLREQGYDKEAEQFQIQVLDERSRTLGEEHPDTINAINDLACTYWNLGKYADAEKLQIKVLDLRNRYLGDEDLDTIWAVGNLAVTYQSLGKYVEAEKLSIDVSNRRDKLLGEEHPDTITAMNSLASAHEDLGKYAVAEKLQTKVLDLRNKLFEKEDPDTISAMSNLAHIYQKLAKYADAERLQIKVLDLRNKLLGEEHPDTIQTIGNLANAYYGLGKYADAEELQIKVQDLRNKLL